MSPMIWRSPWENVLQTDKLDFSHNPQQINVTGNGRMINAVIFTYFTLEKVHLCRERFSSILISE